MSKKKFNYSLTISILDYIGFVMGILSFIFLFVLSINPQFALNYLNNSSALILETNLQLGAALAPGYLALKLIASFISSRSINFTLGARYEIIFGILNVLFLIVYLWTARNIIKKDQRAKDIQLMFAGLSIISIFGLFKNVFEVSPVFIIIQVLVGLITGYWVLKKIK